MNQTQLAAVDFDLENARSVPALRDLLTGLCDDLSQQLAPHGLLISHSILETPSEPVDVLIVRKVMPTPSN